MLVVLTSGPFLDIAHYDLAQTIIEESTAASLLAGLSPLITSGRDLEGEVMNRPVTEYVKARGSLGEGGGSLTSKKKRGGV